jgi:hypothetical protein
VRCPESRASGRANPCPPGNNTAANELTRAAAWYHRTVVPCSLIHKYYRPTLSRPGHTEQLWKLRTWNRARLQAITTDIACAGMAPPLRTTGLLQPFPGLAAITAWPPLLSTSVPACLLAGCSSTHSVKCPACSHTLPDTPCCYSGRVSSGQPGRPLA